MSIDPIVGVDTVVLTFPVLGYSFLRSVSLEPTGTVQVTSGTAVVEASLPHFVDGSNLRGLSLEKADDAISDLLAKATAALPSDQPPLVNESVRVKRIDLVRDFREVEDIPAILSHLARTPQQGNQVTRQYRRRGLTETLTVGAKTSWAATLYDKHKQSGGMADAGHLRFESRLWDSRLRSVWSREHGGNVNVVADLQPEKLEALACSTWDVVGFGQSIPIGSATAAVMGSDLTPSQKMGLLGSLRAREEGFPTGLSPATERNFRRLEARLLGSRDAGLTLRTLDWNLGALTEGRPSSCGLDDLLEEVA